MTTFQDWGVFSEYEPETRGRGFEHAIFFKNEQEVDFYSLRSNTLEPSTDLVGVFLVDPSGSVLGFSEDVTSISPSGFRVVTAHGSAFNYDPSQPYEWDGSQVVSTANVVTEYHVDVERDRRMRDVLSFQGNTYDVDEMSLQRITGAATLAGFAVAAGAQPGNFRWHGGNTDFAWITSDNQTVTLDAPTVFSLGQAAANWESLHIFAARSLKDMNSIPQDYTNDSYWPNVSY